ncbi:MAG: hypothetical protein QOH93_1212 [Chloroflexia bacterium]|nr:hypothetical protein [Chloroflexia bacterium]
MGPLQRITVISVMRPGPIYVRRIGITAILTHMVESKEVTVGSRANAAPVAGGGRWRNKVSSRHYVCTRCGTLRKAPVAYLTSRRETWAEVQASSRWPQHCEQPMKQLTFTQAEGATQLAPGNRLKWMAAGMHLLRQHQRGKHKWKPVTTDWQIEEAKQQKSAYFVSMVDRARQLRRRRPARVAKRRQFQNAEEK